MLRMDDEDIKLDLEQFEDEFNYKGSGFIPLPLLLGQRELGGKYQHSTVEHLQRWGEESLAESKYSQLKCQLPGTSKSTFLMVFSPDGTKIASTHGDHNIYVTDVKTGKCICTLKGHPRTPWTVAFHPSSNEIVASGCLDGQVRVWDLKGGSEVWTPEKKHVIASLAFHPTDQVLVIATDNELYFWDWFCPEPFAKITTGSEREKVKYVKFDPLGYKLITGIANVRIDRHCQESSQYSSSSNNNNGSSSMRNHNAYQPMYSRGSRYVDRYRAWRSYLGVTNPSSHDAPMESGRLGSELRMPDIIRRRRYPRSISSRGSETRDDSARDNLNVDDDTRIGEIRHPLRPNSNDSASSSSLDSSSSITSGVSGTSNERNTRLSLLWTSRLNRTGNESDNSGGGYDIEERRGEGNVIHQVSEYNEMRSNSLARNESDNGRERTSHQERNTAHSSRAEDNNSDSESAGRRDSTNNGGQGGRWMYYRGKLPWIYSRTRNIPNRTLDAEASSSRATPSNNRHDGLNSLAIPGPSGVSQRIPSSAQPPSRSSSFQPTSPSLRAPTSSLLDPQFGVQLLSRHIENMQRICRSLSMPRTNLELTRHSHDITRLRQIRFMLYDIQHQIRSLRNSVDQTISEEFNDESLNSVNYASQPDSIRTELLSSSNSTVTDQIELEVNIDNDSEQFRFLTLQNGENRDVRKELVEHNIISSSQASTQQTSPDLFSYSTLAQEDPDQMDLRSTSADQPPSDPSFSVDMASPRAPRATSTLNRSGRARPVARLQRPASSVRLRNLNNARNRLVWPWLIRRLPQRRRPTRSRLTVPPNVANISSNDAVLSRTSVGASRPPQRTLREPRGSRRPRRYPNSTRDNNFNSRIPRRISTSATPNSTRGNSSASLVDRRRSSDSERRLPPLQRTLSDRNEPPLRQFLDEDLLYLHPLNAHTRNRNISNNETNRRQNQTRNTESELRRSNPLPNSDSFLPPISDFINSLSNNNAENNTDANIGETEDEMPERVVRAGPPTTSLSSRISVMLAEQEAASHRSQSSNVGDNGSSNTETRPRTRGSQLRSNSSFLSPRLSSAHLNDEDFLLRDREDSDMFLQSLRSLQREIMISHRNRILRRNTLVSGGDLAGATLAAINSNLQLDEINARENLREMRERYRQMLQVMADRLNRLMNRSFLNQHLRDYPGGAFEPENENDPANNSPRRHSPYLNSFRRRYNLRGGSEAASNSEQSDTRSVIPNNSSNSSATSAIDRHMHNLRLLVRSALHLIYQLLNFICNQNVSYEERPISRLPNPFREENDTEPRRPESNSNSSSAINNDAASFDFDLEPGLHNLTTLLETVRMTSEELRNSALATAEQFAAPRSDLLPEASHSLSSRNQPPSRGDEGIRENNLRIPLQHGNSSFRPAEPSSASAIDSNNNSNRSSPRSAVRRRLTNMFLRAGGSPTYVRRLERSLDTSSRHQSLDILNGLDYSPDDLQNPLIQRPLPTNPTSMRPTVNNPRDQQRSSPPPLVIPEIVFSGVNEEEAQPRPQQNNPSAPPSANDDLNFHLRTFGGIPLRFLGRQNAVDRRNSDLEDSPPPSPPRPSIFPPSGLGLNQIPPNRLAEARADPSDLDHFMFFNEILTSRNVSVSFYDPYSPLFAGASNPTHRIQAWDFTNFQIPDISDSCFNVVVPKCKIHFDASVSISEDGNMIAALIPENQPLTRVCVFSLETKMLGQILYSSVMDTNTICVSISPTMKHLVVGIASYYPRLSVHHSEKELVAGIYKLCDNPMYREPGHHAGNLRFLRGIELQRDHRLGSINCIRWMPFPGQGLIYGTNRGHLTMLR